MWFKLDDNFYDHPKVVAAGNAAVGLWVRCAVYSSAYGLDGFVPTSTIRQLADHSSQSRRVARSLLWLPTDGGVVIPDFLEYNPAAADVKARRERDRLRKTGEHREHSNEAPYG